MDIVGLCVGLIGKACNGFLSRQAKQKEKQKEKRKECRDIFILKAMSNAHREKLGFAIEEDGVPDLHLDEISELIALAQLVEAGCHTGDSCYIEPLVKPEQTEPYAEQLRAVCEKYDLPALNELDRRKKIEDILHEMTGRRKELKWHPAYRWSIDGVKRKDHGATRD